MSEKQQTNFVSQIQEKNHLLSEQNAKDKKAKKMLEMDEYAVEKLY